MAAGWIRGVVHEIVPSAIEAAESVLRSNPQSPVGSLEEGKHDITAKTAITSCLVSIGDEARSGGIESVESPAPGTNPHGSHSVFVDHLRVVVTQAVRIICFVPIDDAGVVRGVVYNNSCSKTPDP